MISWFSGHLPRTTPSTSEADFRDFLLRRGVRLKHAPIADLLLAVIRFYSQKRLWRVHRGPDADMLLFQCGCYDWGQGEMFQIGLTRQFLCGRAGDEHMSQLATTACYVPDRELVAIGASEFWCGSRSALAEFEKQVFDHPAVHLAQVRVPVSRAIRWEIV